MNQFKSSNPNFEYLRKKWKGLHQEVTNKLTEEHSFITDDHLHKMAAGSLGGLMLLTTPGLSIAPTLAQNDNQIKITAATSKNIKLSKDLEGKMPSEMRALSKDEEAEIGKLLTDNLGIKVAAEIEGKRLNRSYGLIGGEQHLYRYPGDTLEAHAKSAADWAMYGSSGIAPGLGAWGYFAPSKEAFTEEDEMRERYYLAVQTFLSPGFSERVAEYRDFYKFRKMLVVNPKTGQAVVAVIGDAGPAEWTGKHLGGSPEVMQEVGLAGGSRKGAVLYYFVDDSKDEVPLGPVKVSEEIAAQ